MSNKKNHYLNLAFAGLAAVLSLSACSTTSKNVINLPFQAFGNEPGWSVEIDQERQAEVLLNYGERTFTINLPAPEYSYAGTHYRSTYNQQPLALDILYATCSDTMSDERFEYKVAFSIEGQVLRGCGRVR